MEKTLKRFTIIMKGDGETIALDLMSEHETVEEAMAAAEKTVKEYADAELLEKDKPFYSWADVGDIPDKFWNSNGLYRDTTPGFPAVVRDIYDCPIPGVEGA